MKWPTKAELFKEVKRQFPNLHSQSVQQTVADFCEAISSAESLREQGQSFRYPHRKTKYRQVIFTNQSARVRNGFLILPCGRAGQLSINIPLGITLPGRLMEVRLDYGKVQIICQILDAVHPAGSVIGVDLGVNTVIAATDGEKAIVISGREIKATIQFRNKKLAEISSKQSSKTKGSRRHKRLQRRKHKLLDKTKNKVRDLCHKATRKVADAFPHAKAYVGKPFNEAGQHLGRVQAQQVSQACNARIISQLNYKLATCIEVNEAYSSQTCPVCGERNKCGRVYRCKKCGAEAPRDAIGSTNIRCIGINGSMVPGRSVPNAILFVRPAKYPGPRRVVPQDAGHVARE